MRRRRLLIERLESRIVLDAASLVDPVTATQDFTAPQDDHLWQIAATPNDPAWQNDLLWGMDIIEADLAWSAGHTGDAGGTIIVGVIDTGVDYTHLDLVDNIWSNLGEIPGDGFDNDRNGYIDDVHGWNSITNSGDPMDDHGHGTHVAGTLGGRGNNGLGVVGVNWTVQIAACKFLDASGGGTTANAIECFDYFEQLRSDGHNVVVTNNSWGGGGFSQSLKDAMAGSGEILHIAAAGNSNTNNDSSPHYPSSYDLSNLVAVASTTSSDGKSSFSSYGATSVDLGAPGSSIYSTVLNDNYGYKSGTSMASPHVAGAAAMLIAEHAGMTPEEAKTRILSTVDPISSMEDITVTGGRLNVYQTVDTTYVATPSGLSGSYNTSSSQVDLQWNDNASSDHGFTNDTGYEIWRTAKPKGKKSPNWQVIATTNTDAASYSDSISSGEFIYRVKALNGVNFTDEVLVKAGGGGGGGGKGGGNGGGNGGGKGKPNSNGVAMTGLSSEYASAILVSGQPESGGARFLELAVHVPELVTVAHQLQPVTLAHDDQAVQALDHYFGGTSGARHELAEELEQLIAQLVSDESTGE